MAECFCPRLNLLKLVITPGSTAKLIFCISVWQPTILDCQTLSFFQPLGKRKTFGKGWDWILRYFFNWTPYRFSSGMDLQLFYLFFQWTEDHKCEQIEKCFFTTFPICALSSRWRGQDLFFLSSYAVAGTQTYVCRVALTRDLLKDALPTELPRQLTSYTSDACQQVIADTWSNEKIIRNSCVKEIRQEQKHTNRQKTLIF